VHERDRNSSPISFPFWIRFNVSVRTAQQIYWENLFFTLSAILQSKEDVKVKMRKKICIKI